MTSATFDGATLTIQLPSTGTFDVETDLYSAWKQWAILADNAKYPPAFDTTGGDDIGGGQQIAPYFFCRNDSGWRVKAPTANGEVIIQGNLFPRDGESTLFIESGGFDAFIRQEVSTRAVVATVATGSGLSEEQDALINAIAAKVAQLTFNGNYVQSEDTHTENEFHSWLDNYTNKTDWKASAVDINSILTAIANLNNLSLAEVETSAVIAKETSLDSIASSIAGLSNEDLDLTPVLNAIAALNNVTAAEVRAAFDAVDFKDKNTETEIHTWLDSYTNKANWKVPAQEVADAVWNEVV
jgi:hypothetical protein